MTVACAGRLWPALPLLGCLLGLLMNKDPAVAAASKSGVGDRWGALHGELEPPAQEVCKM